MRRGLISWSQEEVPEAVLDSRVAALQAAMAKAGLDAMIAYTTPARAAAVSWIAGFVPYWNQGLLIVPREGRPVLVSALSNRVNGWMRRNAHVADVRNSARIGSEAGKVVSAVATGAQVGVVDLPHLPAAVIEELAAEGHAVSDASALFRSVRVVADATDLALHETAACIAATVLQGIDGGLRDASRMVASLDGEARRLGAEEIYPAVATDLGRDPRLVRLEGRPAELGETWAVRVSLAYKGAWVRMTRTFGRDEDARRRIGEASAEFHKAIGALPDTRVLARQSSWIVEGTRTALPLEPLAGSMIEDAEALVPGSIVTASAVIGAGPAPVLLAAPVLISQPPLLLAAGAV